MSFLLPIELKKIFLLVVLLFSVCRAQIDLYTPGEFTTVAPNATLCSSTNILGDILARPLNFSWTIDEFNYVNWTYQGLFYPVLGSIQCPRGQGLVMEGVWKCNPDTSKTGDRLAALNCPPSANEPTFGPGNTVFCDPDNDALAGIVCSSGSILKSNGAGWFCSVDNNYLAGATNGCVGGDVLRYFNGFWQCAKPVNDSDILRSLIPACTNAYIPKYIGGIWVCALDFDVLRYLNCAAGARVQRNAAGTLWICGPKEQDTFRDVTNNCTGNRDTPFFTADGWDCRPTPAINNSILLGTILYEWSVTLQSSGQIVTSPSSQLQVYLVPYAGQLRGFQLKVSPFGLANMTASVFLNGARIYTTSFLGTLTRVVGSADLGVPFAPNSNVSFALTSGGPGGGYVNLGVYAQVLAV
eukprot:TRINITY_DN3544_c0_g1_i1.p1 TRINITY_DN3544_c0_g1~~TRINITY_DN3544_c0_g1_i1.p1  ORF type:complete len:411 (-),score=113.59 TRINITY_DN3544_c0_g1_i1:145-1377(-)